jgi:hypothetical protein
LTGFRDASYSSAMVIVNGIPDWIAMIWLKQRMKREQRAEWQAAKERRYEARLLLFAKGSGQMKNLNTKERDFVLSIEKEGYEAYLHRVRTGESRFKGRGPKWTKALNPNRGKPVLNFKEWRVIWYKGNKAVFRRHDTPKLVRQRFAELQAAKIG